MRSTELVDNALDADETIQSQIGHPHVDVEIVYDRQYASKGYRISVRNNAPFPMDHVEELFDLSKRVSVKDYYNYPTRGAQGNALKTILGMPYALQYRFFSDYVVVETPLSITYGNRRIELWLDVDELDQSACLRKEEKLEEDEMLESTTISVNLPRFIQRNPRTTDELMRLARAFALFNPHASFSFQFVFIQGNGKYIFEEFHSEGDANWNKKYDLS